MELKKEKYNEKIVTIFFNILKFIFYICRNIDGIYDKFSKQINLIVKIIYSNYLFN